VDFKVGDLTIYMKHLNMENTMSVRFAVLFTIAGIASSAYGPAAVAAAPATPIKIQTYVNYSGPVQQSFKILSVVDSVEIKSITLNRGNCEVHKQYSVKGDDPGLIYTYHLDYNYDWRGKTSEQLAAEGWTAVNNNGYHNLYRKLGSVTLKYGQTQGFTTSCGEILEMVIKTNLGEFKFGAD
jgi:hypothetical protein